jgi:hypothetical protein
MPHCGDQDRQFVALRLALAGQTPHQFRLDPVRPDDDIARRRHVIPLQKKGGILDSHTDSSRQASDGGTDGW